LLVGDLVDLLKSDHLSDHALMEDCLIPNINKSEILPQFNGRGMVEDFHLGHHELLGNRSDVFVQQYYSLSEIFSCDMFFCIHCLEINYKS
jgi:hypothetical protein